MTTERISMPITYNALVIDNINEKTDIRIKELQLDPLKENEVTIKVSYSSVNYKDGLATLPKGGVVKNWPHIPGIDMAGTIIQSRDKKFKEGDEVLCTGYDLGVSRSGGYTEITQIPTKWLVKIPSKLTMRHSMMLGTAGFTASLAITQMSENGLNPDFENCIITGASGGVGSIATILLSNKNIEVTAVTGKQTAHTILSELGAKYFLSREEASIDSRPLEKEVWSAAIDQVGGKMLSWILPQIKYKGKCAVTGLTGGAKFESTVLPLILRGISILGVDSVFCPMQKRLEIWDTLAEDINTPLLEKIVTETNFKGLPKILNEILKGEITGRTIVKIN